MTTALSVVLHGSALVLYAVAAALAPRRGRGSCRAWVAGAVLHAGAIVLWWRAVGHGPYLGPFEVLSADAWLVAASVRLAVARAARPPALERLVYGAAALLLALALLAGPRATPLPLVMRSAWLVVHVFVYQLAFAALVLSVATAFVAARAARAGDDAGFPAALPYRHAGVAFALWTSGMLLGSTWAYDNRGSFWAWEAVEIWALVTWIVLGIALHVHRFWEPGPRAQAWLHAGCLALACFSLFGAPLLPDAEHGGYLQR